MYTATADMGRWASRLHSASESEDMRRQRSSWSHCSDWRPERTQRSSRPGATPPAEAAAAVCRTRMERGAATSTRSLMVSPGCFWIFTPEFFWIFLTFSSLFLSSCLLSFFFCCFLLVLLTLFFLVHSSLPWLYLIFVQIENPSFSFVFLKLNIPFFVALLIFLQFFCRKHLIC